jgi:hypothetical protein
MRVIPTGSLVIDPDVQLLFALSETRWRAMAANWRPERIGFLVVVPNGNGSFYVVEGRHRLKAGTLVGVKEWRCDVHDEIDARDVRRKAELKLGFDRERRHVGTLEHFLIRLLAEDPVALTINRIVTDCGFDIGKTGGGVVNRIAAVTRIEGLFKALGEDGFRRVMQLNTHWLDDPGAANARWIGALGILVRDDYDQRLTPTHIDRMRTIVPIIAIRAGTGAAVQKGAAALQGGSGTFSAVEYETATYIRKKLGMRSQPRNRVGKDTHSRAI